MVVFINDDAKIPFKIHWKNVYFDNFYDFKLMFT